MSSLERLFKERLMYAQTTGPCNVNDMLYYIEKSDGRQWVANKPVLGFSDTHIMVGWGMPIPLFTIEEYGKTCSTDREFIERLIGEV